MAQRNGRQRLACVLACVALASTGCSRKPTTQQVADQLRSDYVKSFSTGGMILQGIDCTDGSGEWDYLCRASFAPKPAVGLYGIVPPHRLGVRFMGEFQGKALFTFVPFPEGADPVPTMDQIKALRKKEAARVESANTRARLAAPK
jgi:hypothetical protein